MGFDLLSLWILGGLVLMIFEMLTGGFFLLFIALGCFVAALTASLNASFTVQAIACAFVAIAGLLLLRKPLIHRFMDQMKISNDLGKEIRVDQDIAPHRQARISYQGTSWLATNLGAEPLTSGDLAIIVGMDGNVLLLRKLN